MGEAPDELLRQHALPEDVDGHRADWEVRPSDNRAPPAIAGPFFDVRMGELGSHRVLPDGRDAQTGVKSEGQKDQGNSIPQNTRRPAGSQALFEKDVLAFWGISGSMLDPPCLSPRKLRAK
jgi:hypothetical protein